MSYSRARFMAAEKKRSTLINKLKYGETKYPQTKARGYYSDLITQGADLGELEVSLKQIDFLIIT